MGSRELFGADFQLEVEGLRPLWRRRLAAEGFFKRPARVGDGPEYRDSRPYSPGDDIRRLDPAALMRHDTLQVRRYQEREEPRFLLLLDASLSMQESWQQARLLAGGLAFLALDGGATVSLAAGSEGLAAHLAGLRGLGAVPRALNFLQELEPVPGPSALDGLVRTTLARLSGSRRGIAFLFSDLFLELSPGVERLQAAGWELVVFHLLAAEDALLEGSGAVEWVDAETGALQSRVLDASLQVDYAAGWQRFCADRKRSLEGAGARVVAAERQRRFAGLLRDFLRG